MARSTTIIRSVAAIAILAATTAAFIGYYAKHSEVREQLQSTPLPLLASLLALYSLFLVSLALINSATLRLSRTKLPTSESLLLTIYSSIINFFGPLQSGPAFRAVYLKTKYGTSLREYSIATFAYYGLYALFSGLFLVSGILQWWLIPVCILLGAGIWLMITRKQGPLGSLQQLDLRNWYYLAGATLLQICIITVIYYVELRSVLPYVTLAQTIIYTGAANFALFVSLTPGAIGFRESFLVFSQQLHHVPNSAIIVANTIDRTVYVGLLLILAVGIFSSHTQQRFKVTEQKK